MMNKKVLLVATILALSPVQTYANDVWSFVGGMIIGGALVDKHRDREVVPVYPPTYNYGPPPMRRVVRCYDNVYYDVYGRPFVRRECYQEWEPVY